jgi:hypothetical protein
MIDRTMQSKMPPTMIARRIPLDLGLRSDQRGMRIKPGSTELVRSKPPRLAEATPKVPDRSGYAGKMNTMDEQAEPLFFIADLRDEWTCRCPCITL